MQSLQTKTTDKDKNIKYFSLKSLVDYKKGKKPNDLTNIHKNGLMPYIDIEAFEKNILKQYTADKTAPTSTINDVLVVWDGARSGLSGIAEGVIGSTIMKLTPKEIEPEYLLLFLQSKYHEINTNHRGTGIPHVNPDFFWNLEVPVYKKEIRDKIIKNYKTLKPILNDSIKNIYHAKQLIQKFRKAVLSAAVTGKLTDEWIEKNNTNINNERIIKYNDDSYCIPDHWKLRSIKDIALSVSTGPFGSSLHQYDYTVGGAPVINPQHIVDGHIIPSERITISDKTKHRLSNYVLHRGNIVIARRGEMGRCAVVTEKEDGWLCGTGCFFIVLSDQILSDYFQIVFSSNVSIRLLSDNAVGSTMRNLNRDIINRHPIPLPSIEEQKQILKRVEYLFSIANEIEEQIENSQNKVEKLTQSILAKTFRGELV